MLTYAPHSKLKDDILASLGIQELELLSEVYDHLGTVLDYKGDSEPLLAIDDSGVHIRYCDILLLIRDGNQHDIQRIRDLTVHAYNTDSGIDITAEGCKTIG